MTRIQLRRGNAAAWTASNPVLAAGEVGVESDTLKYKIGDGSTAWTSLGYAKSTWSTIEGKPAVIAAGATQADARTAIGAGTSSLVLGTTDSTAKRGDYTPTSSEVTTALGYTPENPANKGQASGYASLDSAGLVPATQLPSYVDDVLEYANLAGFPGTGETGKIYVARDTGKIFRWSGSVYIEISPSPGSTDSVTEGSTNLYFTAARAQAALTTALSGKLDSGATAAAASKLATARTIQVNLGSTGPGSFDGTANITVGFTGSLPQSAVTNLTTDLAGKLGTGATAAAATKLATARNLQVDLSAVGAVGFDGTGNANLGVTGSLPQSSVLNLTTDLAGKLATGATAAAASKLSPGASINGVTFDGTTGITVVDATKMPTISAVGVKTSAYSAAVNELVPADASGGGFTVTLPSAPANNSRVIVKKVDSSTNAVTIACSGSDKFNTTTGGTTRLLQVQSEAVTAQYNSTLGVWYVIATDSPITQLDSRYLATGATAASATKLATARTFISDLGSTSAGSFDGTGNATAGVTGILPITNGGIGTSTANSGGIVDDIPGYVTTIPRWAVSTSQNLSSGTLHLSYFTPHKNLTATKVVSVTGNTAAGATPTLCRIGIYSVDGSNNLTLIGSLANDTTLWNGTYGVYTKTLSASTTLTAGSRYAIGALIVTSAAAPALSSSPAIILATQSPRLIGSLTGQTDLPASISSGSVLLTVNYLIFYGLAA